MKKAEKGKGPNPMNLMIVKKMKRGLYLPRPSREEITSLESVITMHLNVGLVTDRKRVEISRDTVGLSVVMEDFKANIIIVERMGIEGETAGRSNVDSTNQVQRERNQVQHNQKNFERGKRIV